MTEQENSHWTPEQYLKFADHRLRPALELLWRIPLETPNTVVDLGCGAGNVTRLLAERWPEARVFGLDHSREMLQQARGESARVDWQVVDIARWRPDETYDLIFSNAVLHWLPEHNELFPRLLSYLTPGGCLAVQMPLSWSAASHHLMRETLARGGVDQRPLGDEGLRRNMERKWVEESAFYYDLIAAPNRQIDLWETEYLHVLDGSDPIFDWVRSTGLRPILQSLKPSELKRFLGEYKKRLREAYPQRFDGRTLFPFRRLFMIVVQN